MRARQNGRHFPDDIFKWIFLNENVWISIHISLKFVPRRPINNIPAMVQIMTWRRPGDKPLSEPMMVSSPTHICVARPQWVNDDCDRSPGCGARRIWITNDKSFVALAPWSLLVRVIACRRFDANPLPETIIIYCQSKFETFHTGKCVWKCRLQNNDHHAQDLNVFMLSIPRDHSGYGLSQW